jgi:hypothetical protein
MSDVQGNEQEGTPTVAGGIESSTGPAGPGGATGDGGAESVSISGADLDVSDGAREESGSALDADDYEGGAAESGGTGGANAGGAG